MIIIIIISFFFILIWNFPRGNYVFFIFGEN